MKIRSLVLSLILLLCLVMVSQARTIYVPDDYEKIQWAVDNASVGDIIIVRDGIYNESVYITKSLTIKSENGTSNCIIQPPITSSSIFVIQADNVTIKGFNITGSLGSVGSRAIAIYGGDNCKILSNDIHDNYYGIYLGDVEISPGNYDVSENNIISDNKIHNNLHSGILVFRTFKGASNNIITSNDFYHNNINAIYLIRSDSNRITLNNIHNNGNGIYFQDSLYNYVYVNNFVDNAGSDIAGDSGNYVNTSDKKIYIYNGRAYYGNLGNYYSNYTGTDYNGDGIGDTPFVNDNGDVDEYPLMLPFEHYLPPEVKISTDKRDYRMGDTMILNVELRNPNVDSVTVNFTLRIDVSFGNTSISRTVVNNLTLTLPSHFKKVFSRSKVLPPTPTPFKACWIAELYDPSSKMLISTSSAKWTYKP